MKETVLFIGVICLSLLTTEHAVLADDPRELLQKEFDSIIKENGLPGAVGAVIANGKVLAKVSTGVRKLGDEAKLEIDDKVHIGSCTKAMTATLIGILVQEKKLSWDSTLPEVFPELATEIHEGYREVTISQFLSHYSGAPSNVNWHGLGKDKPLPEQRLEMIKQVYTKEPHHKPGEKYVYSNVGVATAGAMAEKVTGKSWEELMRERLFAPLKMESAGFGPPSVDGKIDQPWGHSLQFFKLKPNQIDNAASLGPAGTVHLSIEDWSSFASLHLGTHPRSKELMSSENWKRLHTPYPELNSNVISTESPYGFGWVFADRPWAGGRAILHDGSNTTWNSVIWLAPEKKAGFLAVTNAYNSKSAAALDKMIVALIKFWESESQTPASGEK